MRTGPCAFGNTTSDTEEVRRATRATSPNSCFCTGTVRSFKPGRRRRSYLCRLGTQQDLHQDTGQKMVPRAQHGGVKDQKKPSRKGNIAAQSPQARGERVLWCNARNKGGVKKRVRAALLRNHARTRASFVEPSSSSHPQGSERRASSTASPSLLEIFLNPFKFYII